VSQDRRTFKRAPKKQPRRWVHATLGDAPDPRWTAISSSTIRDPRVDVSQLAPGVEPPQVVVTQLLDHLGRHWERWGAEAPVLVGGPPAGNEEDA
jgi:hypothetical protein